MIYSVLREAPSEASHILVQTTPPLVFCAKRRAKRATSAPNHFRSKPIVHLQITTHTQINAHSQISAHSQINAHLQISTHLQINAHKLASIYKLASTYK